VRSGFGKFEIASSHISRSLDPGSMIKHTKWDGINVFQECPGPIALEPCHGNRAAVLSCLVSLPTGGKAFAPPGQSGGFSKNIFLPFFFCPLSRSAHLSYLNDL